MIIDITNELLDSIDSELSGVATVSSSYQSTPNSFPYVTFRETSNNTNIATKDSSGETHNDLSFEIEIYTKGSTKMSDGKAIRNTIDGVLSPKGLIRGFSDEVPNFLDGTIYRYIMRYSCTIDTTKTIYGR